MSVPPDFLSQLAIRIAAAIHVATPDLRECTWHPGRFDLAELSDLSTRAPAVRVALLSVGAGVLQGGSAWHHPLRMGAFVITDARSTEHQDIAAVAIVQRLLQLIPGNRWNEGFADQAEDVAAQNLFAGRASRNARIGLWGVSWTQRVALQAAPEPVPGFLADACATGLGPAAEDPVLVSQFEAPS